MLEKRKKLLSALPLKLDGSQALAQGKKNVLAHLRCDRGILATRK
jgi:hypothetical protein